MTDMSVTKRSTNKKMAKVGVVRDRRGDLLKAAAVVFTEKGYHDTKVSDIVARAGVAQGTFYLYFRQKSDILAELIGACCRDILTKLRVALDDESRFESAAALRRHNIAFLSGLFHLLENEHEAVKLILAEPVGVDPLVDASMAELKSTIAAMIRDNLEKGIAFGCIRPLNSAIVAEALVGMIYHIAFERFVRGRLTDITLEKLAEELVDLEHLGIGALRSQ